MTLKPYTVSQIDELGLRLFDLAARVRAMSLRSQDAQAQHVPLHDKKALEWIGKLEEWALRSEQEVDLAIRRAQGARRASEIQKRSRGK